MSNTRSKVLLLVDWDNLFINLFNDLGPENIRLDEKIKHLMEWVKGKIGELLGGTGFVFAPEHLSYYHQRMCSENGLKLIICPKEQISEDKQRDTVDENIIWFSNLMIEHPEVKYLCLVSGDSDYIPMLKEVKQRGVKVALVMPTINSFSNITEMVSLADINAEKEKLILLLEKI